MLQVTRENKEVLLRLGEEIGVECRLKKKESDFKTANSFNNRADLLDVSF